MSAPLPELTHLQFLVLDIIGSNTMKGREIREQLKHHGMKKGGPAFYQLMARLEEAKMVKGWYTQEIIDGQIIKERSYHILGSGARAYRSTARFYSDLAEDTATPAFAL